MGRVMGTEQVVWMRTHGVLSASWHPDGTLAAATLTEHFDTSPQLQSEPAPEPKDDEAIARANRHRMFRAGPGFRLKDG